MGVRVNVHSSKIMLTPIKVSVRTYVTYANCRTLNTSVRLLLSVQFRFTQLSPDPHKGFLEKDVLDPILSHTFAITKDTDTNIDANKSPSFF